MMGTKITRDVKVDASEGQSTCPLCGLSHGDRTDLRVHLMTSHSKSEITEQFLCAREEPAAPL